MPERNRVVAKKYPTRRGKSDSVRGKDSVGDDQDAKVRSRGSNSLDRGLDARLARRDVLELCAHDLGAGCEHADGKDQRGRGAEQECGIPSIAKDGCDEKRARKEPERSKPRRLGVEHSAADYSRCEKNDCEYGGITLDKNAGAPAERARAGLRIKFLNIRARGDNRVFDGSGQPSFPPGGCVRTPTRFSGAAILPSRGSPNPERSRALKSGEDVDAAMECFGEYLKSLREERGVSLDQISENTKIAVSNLDFLEKDRYDLLPPRVFVKGFIRSYVTELGVDPEEAVRKFEEFTKEGEVPDYEEEHPIFHQNSQPPSFIGGPFFTAALTAVGVLALGILILTGVTRLFFDDEPRTSAEPTVTTAAPSNMPKSSEESPGNESSYSAAFTEPPRTQAGRKILEIKALNRAWVRVEPDTGPAEELIMSPGDVQIFTAKESFHLQTGNAGGIRLRYDGKELPALGDANQTLSLTLP